MVIRRQIVKEVIRNLRIDVIASSVFTCHRLIHLNILIYLVRVVDVIKIIGLHTGNVADINTRRLDHNYVVNAE